MASDVISQELAASAAGLVELRRELHRHPELAFAEEQTAALVAERLDALGLTARTGVGGSGVVGEWLVKAAVGLCCCAQTWTRFR